MKAVAYEKYSSIDGREWRDMDNGVITLHENFVSGDDCK